MSRSRWFWLGFSLGALVLSAGAISVTPRWRAELGWAVSSMITPAGRAGVRLQR